MSTPIYDQHIAPKVDKYLKARIKQLAIAGLDKEYELGYIDYNDRLTDDQIRSLVEGDYEEIWDSFDEWLDQQRWEYASEHTEQALLAARQQLEASTPLGHDLEELVNNVASDHLEDDIRDRIMQRDTFDPLSGLASNSGQVMLRVPVGDDPIFQGNERDSSVPDIVAALGPGVKLGRADRLKIRDALRECGDYVQPMWLFTVRVGDIADLGPDRGIRVTRPYLMLSNPYAGDGWVTDEPLDVTIELQRDELSTDKAAAGYGWEQIAGCCISAYEADIEPLEIKE